ncbi:hypothetical protein H6G20_06420 [Desertifilum sp. FACHB-1129]|nr:MULTISPECIES: hypothetical protein [unclassified Desertifilum]MBD2311290.1 hypothetical protein [Desertifilum sp. FACHB-1129]MBD2321536.1 hypothetical protein [Desertifilum sp. FACHB-866]MBD2331663.1 hypothetical protein [Desertifilum sp. FACHB-868]MDA0213681.1 hypothetical protein [Cyanobacteria bacterium FC1]
MLDGRQFSFAEYTIFAKIVIKKYMIVNSNSLRDFYPGLKISDLEGFLVDTWFIEERDTVFKCTFSYAKSRSCFDPKIIEVLEAIKNASSSYTYFKPNEIFISYPYQPSNIFYRLLKITPSYLQGITGESIFFDEAQSWEYLYSILYEYRARGFSSLWLNIDCDLDIFSSYQRQKVKYRFKQGMDLMIIDQQKQHSENKINSCSNFSLSIGLKFWSLLIKDNREIIMMTYLFSRNLLKRANKKDRNNILKLLEIENLYEIERQAASQGGIEVTQEDIEFYECCILVLPDEGNLYLRENQELADINRPTFLSFIEKLEQSLNQKGEKYFPELWP